MNLISQNIFLIFFLTALLCCSAFFSGTETAMFSLTRIQLFELQKEERISSRLVFGLLENPSDLLVSVLFGNLTVNILFFCLSTLLTVQIGKFYGTIVQFFFGILSLFLVIIFGEIVPKAAGLKFSLQISRISCYVIFVWIKISKPFRKVIAYVVAKIFPIKDNPISNIDEKELKLLLDVSEEKGALDSNTSDMIEDIIAMVSLKAKHIMIPRVDFNQCSATTSVETAILKAKRNNLFLLPVYKDFKGEIIGFLDIKKICLSNYRRTDKVAKYLEEAEFTPETKNVAELLNEMQDKKHKVVFVVDEYGDIAGMITKEKLLMEITGELSIERETSGVSLIQKIDDNKYRVQAAMPIHELDELFSDSFNLLNTYNVSSVGGFVVSCLGHNPKEGESIEVRNLTFEVEKVKRNRIISLFINL